MSRTKPKLKELENAINKYENDIKEAQALINRVLMTSDLNPANRKILRDAVSRLKI